MPHIDKHRRVENEWCTTCKKYVITPYTLRSLACVLSSLPSDSENVQELFTYIFDKYATLGQEKYTHANRTCENIITVATTILSDQSHSWSGKTFTVTAGIDRGWFASHDFATGIMDGKAPLVAWRYVHAWLYEELLVVGHGYLCFATADEATHCQNVGRKLSLLLSVISASPEDARRDRFAFREAFGKCLLCGHNTGTALQVDHCVCGAVKRTNGWLDKLTATLGGDDALGGDDIASTFRNDYRVRVFNDGAGSTRVDSDASSASDMTGYWRQLALWLGTDDNVGFFAANQTPPEPSTYEKHYIILLCTHLCLEHPKPDTRKKNIIKLAAVWQSLGKLEQWSATRETLLYFMQKDERFNKSLNPSELLLANTNTSACLLPGVPLTGCYRCNRAFKNKTMPGSGESEKTYVSAENCETLDHCPDCKIILPSKKVARSLLQWFDIAVQPLSENHQDTNWLRGTGLVIDIFNSMVDESLPLLTTTYDLLIQCTAVVDKPWTEILYSSKCARIRAEQDIKTCQSGGKLTTKSMEFLCSPFSGHESKYDGFTAESATGFVVDFLTCWEVVVGKYIDAKSTLNPQQTFAISSWCIRFIHNLIVQSEFIKLLNSSAKIADEKHSKIVVNTLWQLSTFPAALGLCYVCGRALLPNTNGICSNCSGSVNAVQPDCLPLLTKLAKQSPGYNNIEIYYRMLVDATMPEVRRTEAATLQATKSNVLNVHYSRTPRERAFPELHFWVSAVNYCVYKQQLYIDEKRDEIFAWRRDETFAWGGESEDDNVNLSRILDALIPQTYFDGGTRDAISAFAKFVGNKSSVEHQSKRRLYLESAYVDRNASVVVTLPMNTNTEVKDNVTVAQRAEIIANQRKLVAASRASGEEDQPTSQPGDTAAALSLATPPVTQVLSTEAPLATPPVTQVLSTEAPLATPPAPHVLPIEAPLATPPAPHVLPTEAAALATPSDELPESVVSAQQTVVLDDSSDDDDEPAVQKPTQALYGDSDDSDDSDDHHTKQKMVTKQAHEERSVTFHGNTPARSGAHCVTQFNKKQVITVF